jgi:phosphopantothenoylcysteine decarboxylase / phosphopantothenate---cysteine ligase
MAKTQKNIILGVTASIAIYKACELIRQLKECSFTVKVVMTKEAEELIKPIVFASLSGNRVYRGGIFDQPDTCKLENNGLPSVRQSHKPQGDGLPSVRQSHKPQGDGLPSVRQSQEIEHVCLAQEADLILIAPATANIIAKLAAGICDDLLTCTVCASKAKILIAPAMNELMYNNKVTQSNIAKLKSCGYRFIAPRKGVLACGKVGLGCLAEVETIVKAIEKLL